MEKPLVSICTITYGHERYIEDTIKGVLMQKVDFPLEFIIADDCSPDNTEKIVQNYINTHPQGHWIKYNRHKVNTGMNPNFIWALEQCKGKFIALCEGDDYWIDPFKLQKQVDFLSENPDYSICFHRTKILKGEVFTEDEAEKRYNKIKSTPITVLDLLERGNFIHTPSVVFRNEVNKFPMEFKYSTVGDYFLHIINSQKGYIKRLDDQMAVYRIGVGLYSTLSTLSMTKKILIYQSCILSFLTNDDQKELLLKRQIKHIEKFEKKVFQDMEFLSRRLGFKDLLRICLLKCKRWWNG